MEKPPPDEVNEPSQKYGLKYSLKNEAIITPCKIVQLFLEKLKEKSDGWLFQNNTFSHPDLPKLKVEVTYIRHAERHDSPKEETKGYLIINNKTVSPFTEEQNKALLPLFLKHSGLFTQHLLEEKIQEQNFEILFKQLRDL